MRGVHRYVYSPTENFISGVTILLKSFIVTAWSFPAGLFKHAADDCCWMAFASSLWHTPENKKAAFHFLLSNRNTYFYISGIDFPKDYYSACVLICICNRMHAIFSPPLLSHPHSRALWGSAWQCKPDLGSSVSAGMNNSPCSGWCAPANGRHTLEQTAGLPLMSLSGLSQIVFGAEPSLSTCSKSTSSLLGSSKWAQFSDGTAPSVDQSRNTATSMQTCF